VNGQPEEYSANVRQQHLTVSQLRRAFLLDRRLRPTRGSILDIDYVRPNTRGWTYPSRPHESDEAIQQNRAVTQEFVSHIKTWREDDGHPDRTPIERHLVAESVPLELAYKELLTRVRVTDLSDSQNLVGALLVIDLLLDSAPAAGCTVYRMSGGQIRERGVDDQGEILNLFQGEAPVWPQEQRGTVYPGDRALTGRGPVAVQIHNLSLRRKREDKEFVDVATDVPVVAVWVSPQAARDILVQPQGQGFTDQDE